MREASGMLARIADWWLRKARRGCELPDIPEVRAFYRAAWVHGFTFGGHQRVLEERRAAALAAIARMKDR